MEQTPGSTFVHDGRRYIPIRTASIDCRKLPVDLYLRHANRGPMLYRSAGIGFTPRDAERLASGGVEVVYITADQHGVYRKMLGDRLTRLIESSEEGPQRQVRQVREACTGAVEDVLSSPGQPEAAQAVREVSTNLAGWALRDSDAFSYLLDMSAHDFYTATHMVNVGVGCGLLLRALRPTDPALLSKVIQGGLLHDVGKRGVPETILNKVGKLEPREWQLVRRHPRLGFEELRDQPGISPIVLEMTRDHHERLDGHGYPNELKGPQIGFAARLCAVVDVYDALTSNRQYRRPLSPKDALALMAEGIGTHFDACMLGTWCDVVQGLLSKDPARAPRAAGVPAKLTLDSFLPHSELGGVVATSGAGRDRRRHPRFKYNALVKATFITQGRPCPVPIGQEFPVLAVDLGQSGMQIRTPWPLALDDLLLIQLTDRDGRVMERHARVVRVTSDAGGHAHAGLQYLAADEAAARQDAA
jgi:HD-GYP domain-containing protein (c-di-GMP phosphodiesterase class II)